MNDLVALFIMKDRSGNSIIGHSNSCPSRGNIVIEASRLAVNEREVYITAVREWQMPG